MAAELVARDRFPIDEDSFVEIVIWKLPHPVRASHHRYKYRFVYVEKDVCVIRFDNEAGKGDHKHVGHNEFPVAFLSIERLYDDFYTEVDQWRMKR